jgi:AcrR family transcriptional regulator
LKTLQRRFGSKDALLIACAEQQTPREFQERAVAPGDLKAAAKVLAERYEATAESMMRFLAVEDRLPVVAETLAAARARHLEWLGRLFAPWLPARGRERAGRLAALFAATEIYVWWSWRHRLGHSRELAEAAMLELLEALAARWSVARGRS